MRKRGFSACLVLFSSWSFCQKCLTEAANAKPSMEKLRKKQIQKEKERKRK